MLIMEEIAQDIGAAVESQVAFGGKPAALAAATVVAVFALLAWSFPAALGFGKGCTRLSALRWTFRRFRVLWRGMSFIPVTILSSFETILCLIGISNCVKSPEPTPYIGTPPGTSDNAECDDVDSRSMPLSPSRTDDPTLGESDLKELISLVYECDGGPHWQLLMERWSAALSYQAWFRDPPVGPLQCRTRTVFENVSPELLRDFFWDDEFRTKWDKMLVDFKTLSVCPQTGTMVVHWIRKLPIIGSEKEYIIVRRIWESKSSYYCITKGASYPAVPKSTNRRRIELYYSSWSIKPVKPRNPEQVMASEVLFFHWEDIGIPKELVKMGARAGMWGLVKRMNSGLQAYKHLSQTRSSPSSYSLLAQATTKFDLQPEMNVAPSSDTNHKDEKDEKTVKQRKGRNPVKWLVVGGLLIASRLTLKVNGVDVLCEAAKCLQLLCIRRRQLNDRKRGEERTSR